MYAVDYISTDITDFGLRKFGPVGGRWSMVGG